MRSISLLFALLVGFGLTACTPASSDAPAPPTASTANSEASTASATSERAAAVDPVRPASTEANDVRTVAERLDDARIATRVQQALVRDDDLRVFDFYPNVVDGRLTLRGDVNTRDQHRAVERIAVSVSGVTALQNEVTVQGQSVSQRPAVANSTTDASVSEAMAYHTVRSGDTLWNIAREYRASVAQIKNLNDLRSGSLRPGQRIRVR